jgi:hypothetical protein
VIQLVLPLHEAAAEPLQAVAEFVIDPAAAEADVDPTADESVVEPLYAATDPAATGAALTETSCLCVWV